MAPLGTLFTPRRLHLLFVAGLVTAIWTAYWPSLEHVPRADQWAYLIDTRNCQTLGELWSASYSYNRVRVVGPGDTDLFRPVLFALLVAEKWWFGNNFMPSQAISILLHTVVVLLFLVLLKRIARCGSSIPQGAPESQRDGDPLVRHGAQPPRERETGDSLPNTVSRQGPWLQGIAWQGVLPYALTAFFALNFASMELVIWAHLHGYLLFLILVLGGLLLLWDYVYRPELTPRRLRWTLAGCWVLALASAFTYELGQFFAVILGIVLAGIAWGRAARPSALVMAGCFIAILPLYQAANRWDESCHRGRFLEEEIQEQMAQKACSVDTLQHTGRFLAFTAVQPFFPSVTGWWYQGERMHIQEPVFGWVKYVRPNAKLLLSYGGAMLFFAGCLAGLWRLRGAELRRLWPMLSVPSALFVLYAAVTVLGRMNLRPSRYVLCSNSYYTYVALLLLLIAAFSLWQSLGELRTRPWKLACAALCVGLFFLASYSSGRIRHAAERLRGHYAEFHAAVRQLEAFIAAHGHEPDFRLAFDLRADDPFPVTHSVPFPLVLFPGWIDNHQPKYVVAFPKGKITIVPAADCRRQHPGPRQLFPDLVRIGTDFNVYYWQGKYYGTLRWDDTFRPGLKDHAYVIEGDTLRAVLDEVPVRYEEFMEDLRTGWCIPPRLGTEVIDQDYNGFALVQAGAYYYAVPAPEGPFHINRFNARRYSATFVADELDTLRRYVYEHSVAAAQN
jgi:hypothetical protein